MEENKTPQSQGDDLMARTIQFYAYKTQKERQERLRKQLQEEKRRKEEEKQVNDIKVGWGAIIIGLAIIIALLFVVKLVDL